jgi:predicted amidophosphoribosyltransferase
VFLHYKLPKLKRKYRGYDVVCAPSNKDSELKRGFSHVEEMIKGLNLKIIRCFKKTKQWKQSNKHLEERANIQNIIKIDKSLLNGVKRVLIVDDVLTSGSTIKTMISQIPSNIVKKVLVLSSNCRILKNEIV